MSRNKKIRKIIIILVYLLIGVVILLNYQYNTDILLRENYLINIISYFVMTGLFLIIFFKNKMNIFEPITFFSLIYIPMFSIVPIIDIISGEILWFGINTFKYGVKATLIAIVGYVAFCIGYTISLRKKKIMNKKIILNLKRFNIKKAEKNTLIIWMICLILSLIYLMSSGLSISYIFTLGIQGEKDISNVSGTPLGFISMFSYSLVSLCLLYNFIGTRKINKIIVTFCTIMIQMIRGFRFIVMILLISHFFMYYIKKRKTPSLRTIVLLTSGALFLIGFIGFYRNSIRLGNGLVVGDFKIRDITDAVLGNFRIYKTYYAIVGVVPSQVEYLYGSQMILYTLTMFIPRFIWANKPYPNGLEAIKVGISDYAATAGQAYPCTGEFYYEFGVIGVIFFMIIFGYLARKLKEIINYKNMDVFNLVIYSVLVSSILQLTIRGYMPSNFYLIVFLILPIIIIKKNCLLNTSKK